jgi:hypothetical protein
VSLPVHPKDSNDGLPAQSDESERLRIFGAARNPDNILQIKILLGKQHHG